EVMGHLRDFMFERVYLSPASEAQKQKAIVIIQDLVRYYSDHPDEVPDTYSVPDADPLTRAIDYVAGMTDRFALRTHDRFYRPTLLDCPPAYVWLCRPPPRLRRYSPASRGRNPGNPTPSPAPPVLPQQAGGKILATPARPNMPGENPLGDR